MFTVWMGIEHTTSCLQVGCSFNKAAWAIINYLFTLCTSQSRDIRIRDLAIQGPGGMEANKPYNRRY